jgi:hypothetical protein
MCETVAYFLLVPSKMCELKKLLEMERNQKAAQIKFNPNIFIW